MRPYFPIRASEYDHTTVDLRPPLKLLTCGPFGSLPKDWGRFELTPPSERQYVLNMMVRRPYSRLKLPMTLVWLKDLYRFCRNIQDWSDRFVFITVRHGIVTSVTDDEWHVDGFSMVKPHVQETDFIWADKMPTQYLNQRIDMPKDFDPLRHNVHDYFNAVAKKENIVEGKEEHLYQISPYVIHRRPFMSGGMYRTFVRISFLPLEIEDDRNTPNIMLPRPKYNHPDLRDSLVPYTIHREV